MRSSTSARIASEVTTWNSRARMARSSLTLKPRGVSRNRTRMLASMTALGFAPAFTLGLTTGGTHRAADCPRISFARLIPQPFDQHGEAHLRRQHTAENLRLLID